MTNVTEAQRQLSQSISEAAFNPSKWRDVCDGFALISNSVGGLLVPIERELRAAGLPHSASLEGLLDRYQKHEWYKRDVREKGLPVALRKGFMLDEDCVDYYAIDRSDYFQEFLKPVGMKWFAGLAFGAGPTSCILSLQRPGTEAPFTPDEMAPLLRYKAEVDTAIAIGRQLGFDRIQAAAAVLEHQERAVIGLSASGRVTYVSPRAEQDLGHAFEISGGWIKAKAPTEEAALNALVQDLTTRHQLFSGRRPVRLTRGNGRPALIAYGIRLPEVSFDIYVPAVALLVLIDPEKSQPVSAELLMDYFRITRAEARLAVSLMMGVSLDQHARDGGVSVVTVRNQLQSLQLKTGARGKAEIVALLSRVIP